MTWAAHTTQVVQFISPTVCNFDDVVALQAVSRQRLPTAGTHVGDVQLADVAVTLEDCRADVLIEAASPGSPGRLCALSAGLLPSRF